MTENLENLLAKDEEFLSLLKDREFALIAYDSFCNRVYINEANERYSCSFRYAGGLIAELRNENEDYLDYYLNTIIHDDNNEEPTTETLLKQRKHQEKTLEIYERLGWRLQTPKDEIKDYKKMIAELEEMEKRPAHDDIPEWYQERFYVNRFSDRHEEQLARKDIYGRIFRAAYAGKITENETNYLLSYAYLTEEAKKLLQN